MFRYLNKKSNFSKTVNGYLKVSEGHQLFWEIVGNKDGIPVVFIHGGPGAKIMPIHHSFFDLNIWKTVLYDQRGCGKSKPYIEIKNNNTQLLVEDLEELRKFLNIDKWLLFGGSWGSTLALCYGIKYPENCLGFLLRGIFLGSEKEIDWFLIGMKKFFPEANRKFLSSLGFLNHENPKKKEILNTSYSKLFNDDPEIHQPVANSWASYEMSCSTLKYEDRKMTNSSSLAIARIESHYFKNNCFLKPNEIINNLFKLKHKPFVIVQGRHDVICPPISASILESYLPFAKLIMVENAGHSAFEIGIKDALLNGMKYFKEILIDNK